MKIVMENSFFSSYLNRLFCENDPYKKMALENSFSSSYLKTKTDATKVSGQSNALRKGNNINERKLQWEVKPHRELSAVRQAA